MPITSVFLMTKKDNLCLPLYINQFCLLQEMPLSVDFMLILVCCALTLAADKKNCDEGGK